MAADLLDRGTNSSVDDSCVDAELTLRRPTRVLRVFAARNRSGAWAYLDQIGWRRVTAPSPAQSRDLLSALCRARLSGGLVTAEVSGTSVVAVSNPPAGPAAALPEPRMPARRPRASRPFGVPEDGE